MFSTTSSDMFLEDDGVDCNGYRRSREEGAMA